MDAHTRIHPHRYKRDLSLLYLGIAIASSAFTGWCVRFIYDFPEKQSNARVQEALTLGIGAAIKQGEENIANSYSVATYTNVATQLNQCETLSPGDKKANDAILNKYCSYLYDCQKQIDAGSVYSFALVQIINKSAPAILQLNENDNQDLANVKDTLSQLIHKHPELEWAEKLKAQFLIKPDTQPPKTNLPASYPELQRMGILSHIRRQREVA